MKDSSSASVPSTPSVSVSACRGVRTVIVYLDKEGLGPEVLPRTEDVEDDLHDVGVLTRFSVWSKLMTLESRNVSQRGSYCRPKV